MRNYQYVGDKQPATETGDGSCPEEFAAKLSPPWMESWRRMPNLVEGGAVGRRAALGSAPLCVSTGVWGDRGGFTVCLAALITGDVYWV